jgi:hypothetical protein
MLDSLPNITAENFRGPDERGAKRSAVLGPLSAGAVHGPGNFSWPHFGKIPKIKINPGLIKSKSCFFG